MRAARKKAGVRFNGEISMGHVLQAVILAVGGASVWFTTLNDIRNLKDRQEKTENQFSELNITLKELSAQGQKNNVELEKLNVTQSWMKEALKDRWENKAREKDSR